MTPTESPLDRRVAEIVAYAEEHGWATMTSRDLPGRPDNIADAVGIGGIRLEGNEDGSDTEWSFMLALGVRSGANTRRVLTLRTEADNFAVTVTLEGVRPQTWGSPRASAWREALADPAKWCGYPDPVPAAG